MKYTNNYSYKQPERTAANNDPADINDLADNWGALDRYLKALEDAQATTQTGLASHTANRLNPHGVTAEQVDAYTRAETDRRVAGYDQHLADKGNPHDTTAEQVGAYTIAETEERLDTRVTRGGELAGNMVLVTSEEGEAVTALILADELESLAGVNGNIQEQLNNISFYNYLPSLPIVTLGIGGDSFPQQADTDLQVIPLLHAAYPTPVYRDAVIQNVQTQNLTQRKAVLYCYFDGTQNDGYIGWRYVTDIDTVLNRANGEVYGVVKDSEDISWLAGEGTVHHAEEADLASAANGLIGHRLGVDGYANDLNELSALGTDTFFYAGGGNTVANKPAGVDAFGLLVQRVAETLTLQVLYSSNLAIGLWYRQGSTGSWNAWTQLATKYLLNSGTKDAPVFKGSVQGNADTATKLQTPRSLRTNLASTATASFDGSANATPGVTGTLPIANGGTGNTTGLAASATKLATARNLSITGGATAAAKAFNGEANVALEVTGLDVSKATAGTLPIANGGTGNTTGLAASATKLATARNLSITGGATAAAKAFNGEANVALEVTALDVSKATAGTLPVARGGTGNTTGTAANSTQLNGQAASYYATASSVTSLTSTVNSKANTADVLTKTNTTTYTPTASYHPATKAYVDANTGGNAPSADTATKLQTARTIQTNLASTTGAAFDGTANITPGVTGTLPIARGGTGNTTGLAASAAKLATARNLSITGGATAAAKAFNGEANVALEVTALDVSKATAGTLPVARGGTGNTTGTAAAAGKLATARNLSITGGATAAAKAFNGEANVALEVTALDVSKATAGTLPVDRGGTGNTTGTAANSTQLNGQAASYYATASSVTSLTSTVNSKANTADVLTKTNTTAYTPTASYHPATKAYVDGKSVDNANTATKLQTARTVQTNLGSTTAASFDGSANITPGVTGTLPVANGGTGNTTGKAADSAKLNGQAATYYATAAAASAAQTTANAAMPKTGGTFTGNLSISRPSQSETRLHLVNNKGTANIRVANNDICYQLSGSGEHVFQTSSGGLGRVVAAAFNTSSSERYKKDIEPVAKTHIDALKQAQVIQFIRKNDETESLEIGVKAEDIAELDEIFVRDDKDDNPDTVNLNNIIFTNLAITQELLETVTALRGNVATLRGNVTALQEKLEAFEN